MPFLYFGNIKRFFHLLFWKKSSSPTFSIVYRLSTKKEIRKRRSRYWRVKKTKGEKQKKLRNLGREKNENKGKIGVEMESKRVKSLKYP